MDTLLSLAHLARTPLRTIQSTSRSENRSSLSAILISDHSSIHSVVNGDYSLFREGVLYSIDTSKQLVAQL